jgi:hypothetical protein
LRFFLWHRHSHFYLNCINSSRRPKKGLFFEAKVGIFGADCHKKTVAAQKNGLFFEAKVGRRALRAVINGPCLLVDVAEQSKRHLSTLETNLNRDFAGRRGETTRKLPKNSHFFAKSLILLTKIDRFFQNFSNFFEKNYDIRMDIYAYVT